MYHKDWLKTKVQIHRGRKHCMSAKLPFDISHTNCAKEIKISEDKEFHGDQRRADYGWGRQNLQAL